MSLFFSAQFFIDYLTLPPIGLSLVKWIKLIRYCRLFSQRNQDVIEYFDRDSFGKAALCTLRLSAIIKLKFMLFRNRF